jgi:hypothetical protein
MLEIQKESILVEEKDGTLKNYSSFKELFVEFSKNNIKIKKITDYEITAMNADNKEVKFSYGMITHTDLKANFEYEINEHRIKSKEKIESLKEDGIFISENELTKLNEQFSFLPEDIIDN